MHLFAPPEIAAPEAAPALSSRVVKLAELRRLLEDKFPAAPARKGAHFLTGLTAMDRAGGLPRAAVTEICGSLGTGSLIIASLARTVCRSRSYAALIDAGRTFDTFDLGIEVLQRLLWVSCEGAQQAVKAADLLLRDGNLPLVVLDLQPLPLPQLRRIPSSAWHRFHRVAEQGSAALVIVTPRPMIEGVKVRIVAENQWPLEAMSKRRRLLVEELDLRIFDKSAFVTELDRRLKSA